MHQAVEALNREVFMSVGLEDDASDAVVTTLSVLRRNAGDFVGEPATPRSRP